MRVVFLLTACTAMAAPGFKGGNIPLSFEPDTGQATTEVRYLARGNAYTLYLAGGGTVLVGQNQSPLRTKFYGANPAARIAGENQQASTTNYFVGNNPDKWRASIPNYGRVRYTGVYPGIDLVFYGNGGDGNHGDVEYDWIVSPGADPQKIRLIFDADRLRIDKQGDLVIQLGKDEYRHRKPVVYQEVAGKRVPVAGMWILHGKEGSFRLGSYDRSLPLVIDPKLIYSTYHGGSGLDYAYAVAVDAAGNTYLTGSTGSTDFPASDPLQSSLRGAVDVFVTKINPQGSARIYTTYLGGGGPDQGNGIAVDSNGNAYVTGNAGSFDFPMMGAIQGTWGGSGDAFVTKLNPTGSALVYSTYLGGNSIDNGTGIAVDGAGIAYVVGTTFSTNFPTVNPYQAVKGAQQDAFVAKINAEGTAWVYATYLGGNNVDEGNGIAADSSGNAYVTGYTASTNFPLQSPFQASNGASVDAFVTKLNPAGSALVYSTYLGGAGTDYGTAIAVDSLGEAYVTGIAGSNNFPVVNAMQPKFGGGDDAFVTKFNASGSALVYSTYLGGGSIDDPYALAIDQAGNAYVTGRTNSSDFPFTNAIQTNRFAFDLFVTELNAAGSARLFSTILGGTGSEAGQGIAVDLTGNIHIAGQTTSTDFPLANAIQVTNGGGAVPQDAIVLLLGDTPPPAPSVTQSHVGNFSQAQLGATYNVAVSNTAGGSPLNGKVTVTESLPPGEILVSMAGGGWSCDNRGATCERSDVLAGGSSYQSITVTVNVLPDAAASVTSRVNVALGGLEVARASDPTTVIASDGRPAFFSGEMALSGGVYFLQFPGSGLPFGYYNYQFFPILYHYDLGYESFVDANDGKAGAYFYDFMSGHYFYSTPSLFPYLYDFTLNAWLYYFPDSTNPGHYTTNPRIFSNLTTGRTLTM